MGAANIWDADVAALAHRGNTSALDLPTLAPALVDPDGTATVHTARRPIDPQGLPAAGLSDEAAIIVALANSYRMVVSVVLGSMLCPSSATALFVWARFCCSSWRGGCAPI
jgi:hypothetical protein